MEERRKNRRLELSSRLLIKRLDQDGGAKEVNIEVTDVSKTGVGFLSEEPLEIGSVYESFLTIWTKEVLHAFIEVIRMEKRADGRLFYGAIFIGMTETEASRIETYSTIETMNG
ncbi:PilZ domain-containing protein [bacterium 0.1xD8-71]|nr:PilZ domain-containing protein [bacterium 0.1xD8-71]